MAPHSLIKRLGRWSKDSSWAYQCIGTYSKWDEDKNKLKENKIVGRISKIKLLESRIGRYQKYTATEELIQINQAVSLHGDSDICNALMLSSMKQRTIHSSRTSGSQWPWGECLVGMVGDPVGCIFNDNVKVPVFISQRDIILSQANFRRTWAFLFSYWCTLAQVFLCQPFGYNTTCVSRECSKWSQCW